MEQQSPFLRSDQFHPIWFTKGRVAVDCTRISLFHNSKQRRKNPQVRGREERTVRIVGGQESGFSRLGVIWKKSFGHRRPAAPVAVPAWLAAHTERGRRV